MKKLPSGSLIAALAMLVFTVSAQAQTITASNNCGGQPVIDGSTMGSASPISFAAFPGGSTYTDSIDTATMACSGGGVGDPDTVVCFTAQNSCTVSVTLEAASSADNTTLNAWSGTCTGTPACATGIATTGNAQISVSAGGAQTCFVGSTNGGTSGNYILAGTQNCGALAVEVLEFKAE